MKKTNDVINCIKHIWALRQKHNAMKLHQFIWHYTKRICEYQQEQNQIKEAYFISTYTKHIESLRQKHDEETAMELFVGGSFEAVGLLEYFLLLQNDLERGHTLIDVGCGSGRLAFQLKEYLEGLYIGIDVVSEVLQYTKKKCNRADWKFYKSPGSIIPEPDNSADFICFFSVFTHLFHEETFKYLKDASRVIKPGGKIIFSFLEFALPSHWHIFETFIADARPDKVLFQFISRDAILAWADHLGLSVVEIIDGDKPHVKLSKTVRWDNGREMTEQGNLGQSICILTKP
jgi:SAM-dependent methyltransferase